MIGNTMQEYIVSCVAGYGGLITDIDLDCAGCDAPLYTSKTKLCVRLEF